MTELGQTSGGSEGLTLRAFNAYEDEPPAPRPTLSELEAFLDRVLCDGRYVNSLDRPAEVAMAFGIDLSPDVAAEIVTTPHDKLLHRLYRARFPGTGRPQMFSPDIGIMVWIAVFITIVVVIWVVKWKSPDERVKDRSPNKDRKL